MNVERFGYCKWGIKDDSDYESGSAMESDEEECNGVGGPSSIRVWADPPSARAAGK